jgi:hypothetical protein
MLGLHGGPSVTHTVTLYAFFGYCLHVGFYAAGEIAGSWVP